ncbi:MAG: (2Fe-2S)-binding protein [Alphaproteobacteria bacterium]|nr:(2Fe-2S)-binding protein [Alphaproteobacteria bacterium]
MQFSRLESANAASPVRFTCNGQVVEARAGDSVATALLLAGIGSTRDTALSGEGRAPYCLMGVCFECLVEIDGVPNQQACLVPVSDGMSVRRQEGAPQVWDG